MGYIFIRGNHYGDRRKMGENLHYDQGLFRVENYNYELDSGEDGALREEYKFHLQRVERT